MQCLLCCVITGNFTFIAFALGRKQFTDAGDNGVGGAAFNMIYVSPAWTTDVGEQLLSKERRHEK